MINNATNKEEGILDSYAKIWESFPDKQNGIQGALMSRMSKSPDLLHSATPA